MKRLILMLLLTAGLTLPAQAEPTTIKLISSNLRNSGAGDGSNSWENRRAAMSHMFNEEAADLFGVQEALADQLRDLDRACPQYARVGVGRDDGAEDGETMAIYYLRERFELLDSGTFWLSETPDEVSRGWDGACNRTATWVHLRDKASGKSFYYFNTHLDHLGSVAREEGIRLLVAKIREIAGRKAAVVLGGDFNSTTESPIFKPLNRFMKSARAKARQTDNKGTFNGFGTAPDTIVIDHLYIRGLRCSRFTTLTGNYGVPYISDHYPIEIVFTL